MDDCLYFLQNGKTEDDQAEELLDFLPKSEAGAETFDLFCEALIADSQGHIVKCYLKTEQAEDKKDGAAAGSDKQEETEAVSVSQSVVPDNVQVRDSAVTDGDRAGPSRGTPSLIPPVAIQEEFQQQMYRRSIEPRTLQHTQSSPCFDRESEHEARLLYQTSLRNPAAVSSAWEKQMLNKMMFDKSVYGQMSFSGDSLHRSSSDGKLVKDSVNIGRVQSDFMSSEALINPRFTHSPSVFNLYSQNEIPLSSMQSDHPSLPKPMDFHLQQKRSFYSEDPSYASPSDVRRELGPSRECMVERSQARNRDEIERFKNENVYRESIRQQTHSPFEHDSLQSSPAKYGRSNQLFGMLEQDCIEIPRYIEVNNNNQESTGRTMVSFPRHVSRVTSQIQPPEVQNEEFSRGANAKAPKLARLDSVGMWVVFYNLTFNPSGF